MPLAASVGATAVTLSLIFSVATHAQAPQSQSSLSPPVNHEIGRVDEVISASDQGYRFRAYLLTWRSLRVVVAGAAEESHAPGDNLDVVVYRSEVNGQKVLHFAAPAAPSDENVVDVDSAASSASVTQGTARVEETVAADSEGYRFAGYFVTWHDQRVFIVDSRASAARAIGDTINFRVLRTGLGANQRLSFSL
jgi:hypothetical protein